MMKASLTSGKYPLSGGSIVLVVTLTIRGCGGKRYRNPNTHRSAALPTSEMAVLL